MVVRKIVNLWDLAAVRRDLLNGWLSLTFEMTQFFPDKFCCKIWLLNWTSAVISWLLPDFFLEVAACFLTLHKHVVSDVIKRLSTFVSFTLSTLAPVFDSFCPTKQFSFRHTLGFFCFSGKTPFFYINESAQLVLISWKIFGPFDNFQLSELCLHFLEWNPF